MYEMEPMSHKWPLRSVLELVALGGIKVDTALRRIYTIIETIEAEKLAKASRPSSAWKTIFDGGGLGRCTERPSAA